MLKYLLAILAWIGIWHFASLWVDNHILLVSPIDVFLRIGELGQEASFWASIAFSLYRIIFGFFLALVIGVALASLTFAFHGFYIFMLPFFNVIKSIPVVSFALLALMWFSASNLSIFIAFVTVLPIVYFNTYEGIKNADAKLLEMAKVFRVAKPKIWLNIYGRSAFPYILSAAASGIGFAFKSGVAAELIGFVQNSIGFNLHSARAFLQTADIFAWTIVIIILSYAIEKIFLMMVKLWR